MGRSVRLSLLATAAALLTAAPTAAASNQQWAWPLGPIPAVSRRFEAPPQPWSPGHRGVDLTATVGQVVMAPADGVVTFAGRVVDRGVLTVRHLGGLRSSVEPVSALLPVGTPVRRGEPIGTVSADRGHCPPATCLHWGVRRGEAYVDPLSLLGPPQPPVLLPLSGAAVPRAGPGWQQRPL
jgi:murein DD-endopeptidase MepM/ murein hydrolase activator NlpD